MTRSTRTVAVLSAAFTVAALTAPVAQVSATPSSPHPTPHATTPVRGPRLITRLIVRTRDGRTSTASLRDVAASTAGVASARSEGRLGEGAELVALSRPVSLDDALAAARALAARPDVLWAEPDSWMYPTDVALPNDPLVRQQWDLSDASHPVSSADFSVGAPAAWSRTRGARSVVVAVIDTGITVHPDLAGQTVPGYDFVSLDPVLGGHLPLTANDGNGRDADPSDPGDWITAADDAGSTAGGFFKGCGGEYPDGHQDSSWHGTHVAGTVAAVQGNALGTSGMAPGVLVEPIRALGKCGGSTSDIIDAIEWASGGRVAGVPVNQHPASVINLSLGGAGSCDTATQTAIDDARSRGTVVVVAAGNSGLNFTSRAASASPADCVGVIDVVATLRSGLRASYSNFGTRAGSLTVAAPGGDGTTSSSAILSTVNTGLTTPGAPGYGVKVGTSMATPHVSAAVALLQSLRAGRAPYTPTEVTALLATLTRPVPGCGADQCGAGEIDLAKGLPLQVPLPASQLLARPADSAVDLSWAPSPDAGGADVTYAVDRDDGVSGWQPVQAAGVSGLTALTVTGLTNLTTYSFRVTAVSSAGSSAAVSVDGVTPSQHAVRALAATGGVEHLTATWAAPLDPTGVTGYAVRARPPGSTAWTLLGTAAPGDTSVTLTTWPAPMAAGAWQLQVAATTADPPVFSPSVAAGVSAFTQSAATSGSVLRPFVDGFQDSVTVTASSTATATGLVRLLSSRSEVVRTVALAPATSWRVTWTGRDSRGRRVPTGSYGVQVLLTDRGGALRQVGPLRPVVVATSQAGRPSLALSSSTVYPFRDGYLDAITITTRSVVPAIMTWRLTLEGKVVWSRSFSRRTAASSTFAGRTSRGALLPAGAYVLTAYAAGGEGVPAARSATVVISAQRVTPAPFVLTVPAYQARIASSPGVGRGPLAGSLRILGDSELAVFAARLPSSVRPASRVRVTLCSHPVQARDAQADGGWFTGEVHAPNFGSTVPLVAGCDPLVPGSAPASAIVRGTVRWFVTTPGSSPAAWQVDSATIVGIRYVLR